MNGFKLYSIFCCSFCGPVTAEGWASKDGLESYFQHYSAKPCIEAKSKAPESPTRRMGELGGEDRFFIQKDTQPYQSSQLDLTVPVKEQTPIIGILTDLESIQTYF